MRRKVIAMLMAATVVAVTLVGCGGGGGARMRARHSGCARLSADALAFDYCAGG